MTEYSAPDLIENVLFAGTKNDVVPIAQQPVMATDEPSTGPHTVRTADDTLSVSNNVYNGSSVASISSSNSSSSGGSSSNSNDSSMVLERCNVDGVSALSLNDKQHTNNAVSRPEEATATAALAIMGTSVEHDSNIVAVRTLSMKAKRRRRKSKQKSNNKPYKKSNWKFQLSRSTRPPNGSGGMSTLVPYNTNKFLMEEHMPETGRLTPSGRNRDSSFSVDSDENLYNEEEFLSKEFSSVYEDARSERLESLSKPQLIQEYLQLEANYDKLSKNLGARKSDYDNAKEVQRVKHFESQDVIRKLEDRIKELTSENQDLRRQMADIRNRNRNNRNHRSHQNGHSRQHHHNNHHHHSVSSGSEDSESDSSTSDSDSDSASSKSSISSRSSAGESNKSSLSDFEDNMSGIDDEQQELLANAQQTDDVPDVVAGVNGDHAKWPPMADCDDNVMQPLIGGPAHARPIATNSNIVLSNANTRE